MLRPNEGSDFFSDSLMHQSPNFHSFTDLIHPRTLIRPRLRLLGARYIEHDEIVEPQRGRSSR